MPASQAVGIDLGSSRAMLARVDQRGHSDVLRDVQGDVVIPAIVYFEDDELLFGRAARLSAASQPGRAADFYKRDLGQAAYCRAIGGELLPPELIEACQLKRLVGDLAAQRITQPAVVLSIPASFNQAQRRARLDAAKIAGIEVLGTIHDPLAAAYAYAEAQGYLDDDALDKPPLRMLVFDLGSGKLDVAIVEIKPRRLRTMAVGGDPRLGGRDWDLRLADHLAAQFAKQFGDDPRHDMASVRRLVESAEEAKHSLTARQQTKVQVARDSNSVSIVVTRQDFEELTADLLDRCLAVVEATLRRSGLTWRDLGQLLLVGGATRMPGLAKRLKDLSGLEPAAAVNADEAVARGAALHAAAQLAAKEGRAANVSATITDLTSHSLGLEWNDAQSGRVENVVLIARGSELPCGTVARTATDVPDQTTLTIQLLEGESRAADECARIAQLSIRELPPGLPQGTQIEVHYQFTAEGRLQVKAQMPHSGRALPISVRRAGGLNDNQIADWKALLDAGGGLRAIHALLPKHRQQQEAQAAAMPPRVVPPARPPALPGQLPAQDAFDLNTGGDTSTARFKRRKLTSRKIVIMVTGYLLSALVGTVIGYYILMRIEPRYNWWHLRLPGLRDAPGQVSGPL